MTTSKEPENQLVFPDRCLLLWIFPSMAAGIATGYYSPAVTMMITNFPIGNSSIPIAIGLILLISRLLAIQKIWNGV